MAEHVLSVTKISALPPGGVYASEFGYDAYDVSKPNTEACMCVLCSPYYSRCSLHIITYIRSRWRGGQVTQF